MKHWVWAFAIWLAASLALAQVPPSPRELASYSGLLAAAAKGDVGAIAAAIAAGADLDARDGHGRSAVHIAAHGSHYEAIKALARAGADLRAKDSRRYDIVTIAAVKNDLAMVELALALGADARAVTSPYDGTALIAAAHLGHAEVVAALIAGGAPLDHVNNLGWTAAMEAVVLGDGGSRHQATLRALVGAGADISIPDRAGLTPLDHARRTGYARMVEILTVDSRR
ncbi:MAG: ankyrin repeat domain-containing protein [Alphaproteobacteria bacterium]|nr:ankyrin repeat domain-containing protein [Alphaproteobacteria bacterium]